MKLTVIHTGKTKAGYIETGCMDYYRRIKHYLSFQDLYLKDIRKTEKTNKNDLKKKEGEQLLKLIQASDYLILFDPEGKSYSSESFASFLGNLLMTGKNLIFTTGGAYGFAEEVHKRSDYKISLSKMTFSHQMVRLVVAEQLYRALTIIKGKPYHHI